MNITDRNMLHLIDILKEHGRLRFEKEFCEAAGIIPQNLSRIKSGAKGHSFTAEQIRNVCTGYMVNANWIFGLEHQVFRGIPGVNVKVNTVNPKGHTVTSS